MTGMETEQARARLEEERSRLEGIRDSAETTESEDESLSELSSLDQHPAVMRRHAHRRPRLDRERRGWRLTARRSAHYPVVEGRGRAASDEHRAALEERFAVRTAEDVAAVLGGMKGAIMKAGQMISFIAV